MTSVVVWVGVDSHGPASAYVATDSRFSWQAARRVTTWDLGRKTFASARYPDVAAFWGDVLFPVVTLSQFFANLDAGVVAASVSSSEARFKALEAALRISFEAVPASQQRPFTIVYVSRDGSGMSGVFKVRALSWASGTTWTRDLLPLPSTSAAVRLGGSGAGVTQLHLQSWTESTQGGTSRAVYSAFVDGLLSGSDTHSGGAPQIVGLYRIGSGRSYGTVVGNKRFLHGAPVMWAPIGDQVEWRNELFERVSGDTRKRFPEALITFPQVRVRASVRSGAVKSACYRPVE